MSKEILNNLLAFYEKLQLKRKMYKGSNKLRLESLTPRLNINNTYRGYVFVSIQYLRSVPHLINGIRRRTKAAYWNVFQNRHVLYLLLQFRLELAYRILRVHQLDVEIVGTVYVNQDDRSDGNSVNSVGLRLILGIFGYLTNGF